MTTKKKKKTQNFRNEKIKKTMELSPKKKDSSPLNNSHTKEDYREKMEKERLLGSILK